jgi:tetratricopeptide (TPR) repeat protein
MNHHDLYQQGSEALERREFDVASKLLRESADLFPHFKTYERIGICLAEMGEHMKAITYFAAAAGLGNKQKVSYRYLAECFIKIGDPATARRMLEKALEIDPMYKTARTMLTSLS